MSESKVYFSDLRASTKENLLAKIIRLIDMIDLKSIVPPRSLVAIKLHFGEKGNIAFIRPNFIRQIVDHVTELGAFPFLTDTNTLYAGTRGDSVSHLNTAIQNGFAYSVVSATEARVMIVSLREEKWKNSVPWDITSWFALSVDV